mgnify:CR=1 FL=1
MISNISITQNQFLQTKASSEKKELVQFFTPSEIATFMASLITLDKDKSQSISVLDAGAGAGDAQGQQGFYNADFEDKTN